MLKTNPKAIDHFINIYFVFLELPIMVATGRNVPLHQNPDYTELCQVVDLISTTPCSNLASYPLPIHAGTGKIVDGIPIICGGQNSSNFGNYLAVCYSYDVSLDNWSVVANMERVRFRAASAVLNGNLWVTGGLSRDENNDIRSVGTTGIVFLINLPIFNMALPLQLGFCIY